METVSSTEVLRARINFWRRGNQRIALVPTMGNLHAGHLALVRRARELAERVIVSSFVNPMQFGPNEDFEAYPRTLEQDQAALDPLGVDLMFVPSADEMYPHGLEQATQVIVPGLSDILCGASRPGHFAGVTTVVAKLFNMVRPDTAVFGRKDYQQLTIIRKMVDDLGWPVELESVETVREDDGLAMSSRNQYLTDEERAKAPRLQEALKRLAQRLSQGEQDYAAMETEESNALAAAGFEPDYLRILDAETLGEPGDGPRVILVAARLGKARLIDNLTV